MKFEDAIVLIGDDKGSSPGMIANIVFRLILNLGAAFACWIPIRLFYRNRELAGAAMITATAILNFYYGVDSLIWSNNDVEAWFEGYGWCDVQLVLWVPLESMNAAAICAVMQNIANQVSLMRASGLTGHEKRRKHIIQALIIFPVPALQTSLYYFTIGMRYNISGIIGCQAVFQNNWVFLVFFILPCPIFAVAAAYFAALTWWRYRQIDAACRRLLYDSGNSGAQGRSARTKRKLYFMALTIVAPYCPMQLVFLFNNLRVGWPWSRTYDLAQLHAPGWDAIDFAPSTAVSFVSMYINYVVFLEVIVFFLFFGGTKDAHEMYRKDLRALGFGKFFPRLNEEWHPSDRPPTTFKALLSRTKNLSSWFNTTHSHSRSSSVYKANTRLTEESFHKIDDTNFLNIRLDSLEVERATATLDAHRLPENRAPFPHRSPGILPFNLAPRFSLLRVPRPAIFRNKTESRSKPSDQGNPEPFFTARHQLQRPAPVRSLKRSSEGKLRMCERIEGDKVAAQRSQGFGPVWLYSCGNSEFKAFELWKGLGGRQEGLLKHISEPWYPSAAWLRYDTPKSRWVEVPRNLKTEWENRSRLW